MQPAGAAMAIGISCQSGTVALDWDNSQGVFDRRKRGEAVTGIFVRFFRASNARSQPRRVRLKQIHQRLRALAPGVLKGILRGIEKESLRVRPDGKLADTPHPARLGSALTHPHITTDFSESQLELITGVHADIDACLEELTEIHQAVYRSIGDEILWSPSMPGGFPADDDIPIGRYGSSNVGRAKTVYRYGLAHRYGRRMQTISGIHYNFSLPEAAWPMLQQADGCGGGAQAYQDDSYFSLIRNFRRHSWLLLYLFGASPAAGKNCRG